MRSILKSPKMRRTIRQVLVGLFFGTLGLEVLMVSPEAVNSRVISDLGSAADLPGQAGAQHVMTGVHLVEASDAGKEWELWAETAFGYKSDSRWKLKTVQVRFFGENETFYVVTGDEGEILTQAKDMTIRGNVHLTSSNGYKFKTGEAVYSSSRKLLTCPTPVEMWGPPDSEIGDFTLQGQRMEVDLTTDRISVYDKVAGHRVMDDGRVLKIRSGEAIFSNKSYSAIFSTDVEIEWGGQFIRGPRAEFQYDRDTKKLSSMMVDGGATLTDPERQASASQVHIQLIRQQITLNGSPIVTEGDNELHGDEIIISNGGKDIRVIKAKARLEEPTPTPAKQAGGGT